MLSLRSRGALRTEMVALYFWAAWIISLMDVGSCSALVLTGHVWPIHSFATFLSTFWCALWSTNSFATSAQVPEGFGTVQKPA